MLDSSLHFPHHLQYNLTNAAIRENIDKPVTPPGSRSRIGARIAPCLVTVSFEFGTVPGPMAVSMATVAFCTSLQEVNMEPIVKHKYFLVKTYQSIKY